MPATYRDCGSAIRSAKFVIVQFAFGSILGSSKGCSFGVSQTHATAEVDASPKHSPSRLRRGRSPRDADAPLEIRLEGDERDAKPLDGLLHRLTSAEVLQQLAQT